jgi:hypothetical protein
MRRLSFKTQFKIEFLGPFYGPKKSLEKTPDLFRACFEVILELFIRPLPI